jgi:alpha-galactosidase
MSLWCILAAPLIATCDLRNMNDATHAILTNPEVIAVDQDHLGRQGTREAKSGYWKSGRNPCRTRNRGCVVQRAWIGL